jgi:hypothetical protein
MPYPSGRGWDTEAATFPLPSRGRRATIRYAVANVENVSLKEYSLNITLVDVPRLAPPAEEDTEQEGLKQSTSGGLAV